MTPSDLKKIESETINWEHKNKSGIYKIYNKINGKVYIGSSFDLYARKSNHISQLNRGVHHSMHLQSAWNKYGRDNFQFSLVEYVDFSNCTTNEQKDMLLKNREKFYIETYLSSNNEFGYNTLLETDRSPMFGRKHTDATRKKMSEWQQGENNNNYNREFTKEHRENLSKAVKGKHKGKKLSEERKNKISNTLKEKKHRPSTEAINKSVLKNSKKIIQMDLDGNFIKVWDSIMSISRHYNVNKTCITDCCKGKQKTSVGYKWTYYDNKESV